MTTTKYTKRAPKTKPAAETPCPLRAPRAPRTDAQLAAHLKRRAAQLEAKRLANTWYSVCTTVAELAAALEAAPPNDDGERGIFVGENRPTARAMVLQRLARRTKWEPAKKGWAAHHASTARHDGPVTRLLDRHEHVLDETEPHCDGWTVLTEYILEDQPTDRSSAKRYAAQWHAALPAELREHAMLVLVDVSKLGEEEYAQVRIVVPVALGRQWAERHADRFESSEPDWLDTDADHEVVPFGARPARRRHVELLEEREQGPADVVLSTGLRELDALWAARGLAARDERLVINAPTQRGKTVVLLSMGEAAVAQGAITLFVTTASEDSVEALLARRLQRLGCPRAVAKLAVARHPDGDEWRARGRRTLNSDFVAVRDELVDQEIRDAYAAAQAEGKPLFVALDALQSARTTNSAGKSGKAAVDAVLQDIAAAQADCPCVIVAASHVSREAEERVAAGTLNPLYSAKESGDIESWAQSLIYLEPGAAVGLLRFRVVKNKGGDHGVSLELPIDLPTQTIGGEAAHQEAGRRQAHADDRVLSEVRELLSERGPLPIGGILPFIDARKATLLRVLWRAVEAGALRKISGRYQR